MQRTSSSYSISDDLIIQDWGIHYAKREPHCDHFEKIAAISGKAGNPRGRIQPGGYPFEATRQNEHPVPPLTGVRAAAVSSGAHRR